jgi:hypothetical protein
MPQPLLHLGDVGAMLQGIGGGRRPHGMHAKTRRRPGTNHVIIPFTILGSEVALRLDVSAQRVVIADGARMGELDIDQTADLSDCRGSGVGCLGGAASS